VRVTDVRYGGEAGMLGRSGLAGPAAVAPRRGRPPLQRDSVRMIHPDALLLVDLPVDAVVVLEQQEGAHEAKRTERSLP
jgi:hypothetical protein